MVTVPALPEIEPVMVFATESDPKEAVCAERLVDDAVVEKRLVVVALERVVPPTTVSVLPILVSPLGPTEKTVVPVDDAICRILPVCPAIPLREKVGGVVDPD